MQFLKTIFAVLFYKIEYGFYYTCMKALYAYNVLLIWYKRCLKNAAPYRKYILNSFTKFTERTDYITIIPGEWGLIRHDKSPAYSCATIDSNSAKTFMSRHKHTSLLVLYEENEERKFFRDFQPELISSPLEPQKRLPWSFVSVLIVYDGKQYPVYLRGEQQEQQYDYARDGLVLDKFFFYTYLFEHHGVKVKSLDDNLRVEILNQEWQEIILTENMGLECFPDKTVSLLFPK